jgi:hypothetical protein
MSRVEAEAKLDNTEGQEEVVLVAGVEAALSTKSM